MSMKFKPSEKTMGVLTGLANAGKNAAVLAVVARLMVQEKAMPLWAEEVGVNHFEKLFSLDPAKLRKACADDSYVTLRNVVNAFCNKKLNAQHKAKAQALLKIQAFAAMPILATIISAETDEKTVIGDVEKALSLFEKMSVHDIKEAYALWLASSTISHEPEVGVVVEKPRRKPRQPKVVAA